MVAVLLAATIGFTPGDAAFAMTNACALVESCTPRDAGTLRGSVAADWIRDRASKVGAEVYQDVFFAPSPRGKCRFTNLYAEFESNPTSRWVVLVSHFDTKFGVQCPGANDGAATTGLLIAFARKLALARDLGGNVILVWTDGEECMGPFYSTEDGLQGSRRAAAYLREKGRQIRAVICLDMLGDRDLAIAIPSNATPSLARLVCRAARLIGAEELVTLSHLQVKDDHVPFLEAGYPAVDLIDFEYGPNNAWWHTEEDTCDKISEESLRKSGRLVAELLNILL